MTKSSDGRSLVPIGNSGGREVLFDVGRFRVSHALITAVSGAGKSYFVRVLMERLFGIAPLWVIDVEGEYASLRSKFDFILIGDKEDGADLSVRVDIAGRLPGKLLALGASVIFDLSSLESEDQQLWVKDFIRGLLHQPRSTWRAMVLVIDEAQTLAPEKGSGSSECTAEVIDGCKRLRKRGVGVVLASQRITEVNNGAVAQMQNYFIGRTILTADIERSAKSLGIPKRKDSQEQFSLRVKKLKDGEFFTIGPAVSDEYLTFQVPRSATPHPEPGEIQEHKPPTPKAVKELLGSLEDIPKEVETEQKEVDDLKSKILQLESDLNATRSAPAYVTDTAAIHKAVSQAVSERDQKWSEVLQPLIQSAYKAANNLEVEILSIEDKSRVLIGRTEPPRVPTPAPTIASPPERTPALQRMPVATCLISHDGLKPGAIRMLVSAAMFYPRGVSEGQVSSAAKVSRKGGSWDTYKSSLKVRGLIVTDGRSICATEAGVNLVSDQIRQQKPQTTAEVVQYWTSRLKAGAVRMLQVLIRHHGNPIDVETLGSESQVSVAGGSFDTYLSQLVTANLAVKSARGSGRRTVAANRETLFL